MTNELNEKTIEELSFLISHREVSPVELTESLLDKIKGNNNQLVAYIDIYEEQAKLEAKKAEKDIMEDNYKGKLHGIPFGIKDNIYMKDKTTTMGSKIHKNFIPNYDATVIKHLRNEGVVFLGKTNMHEYALGATTDNPHFGTCRNPWNLDKIPGGSSGGSAAAIASDMAVGTLGTDTSGSITIPASACGVVGLKPTYGRVSKYGCFPEAWTLDHIGPITKTVKDATIILNAISNFDEKDPNSIHSNPLKIFGKNIEDMVIGINDDYFFNKVDSDIDKLVRNSINKLVELGAKAKNVKLPSLKDAEFALAMTDFSELATVHHNNIKDRPDDFGKDVRRLIESGHVPSAVDYLQAQQIRRSMKLEFKKVFEEVDVLVVPATPIPTIDIGNEFGVINGEKVELLDNITRFTGPINLMGLPSLTLPCGFSNGMPVGMTLIGPVLEEDKIIKMGLAFEDLNVMNNEKPKFNVKY